MDGSQRGELCRKEVRNHGKLLSPHSRSVHDPTCRGAPTQRPDSGTSVLDGPFPCSTNVHERFLSRGAHDRVAAGLVTPPLGLSLPTRRLQTSDVSVGLVPFRSRRCRCLCAMATHGRWAPRHRKSLDGDWRSVPPPPFCESMGPASSCSETLPTSTPTANLCSTKRLLHANSIRLDVVPSKPHNSAGYVQVARIRTSLHRPGLEAPKTQAPTDNACRRSRFQVWLPYLLVCLGTIASPYIRILVRAVVLKQMQRPPLSRGRAVGGQPHVSPAQRPQEQEAHADQSGPPSSHRPRTSRHRCPAAPLLQPLPALSEPAGGMTAFLSVQLCVHVACVTSPYCPCLDHQSGTAVIHTQRHDVSPRLQ